jgi:tRNA nucleotidyltransferase/poly(A) polymerase
MLSLKTLEKQIHKPLWLEALPSKGTVCIYGGAVRDLFCSKESRDFDYISAHTSEYDYDLLGFYNKHHPTCISLSHQDFPKDEIMLVDDIEENLKDKDLTIHALGYDYKTKEWIDPTQKGLNDNIKKILRMPYIQEEVYPYDGNRVLRLIRLSITLKPYGYIIDPVTKNRTIELGKQYGFIDIAEERLTRNMKLIENTCFNEFNKTLKEWGLEKQLNHAVQQVKKNQLKLGF